MDDRDDFERWMTQWAAAQKEIAEEEAANPRQPEPPRASYFTGTPSSSDYDYDPGNEDLSSPDDWHNLYRRALEVDYSAEGLLTDSTNVAYAGDAGYGKEQVPPLGKTSTGGKKAYTNNPVHFSSVGNDQEDDSGVRVTKNWSDGDELRELDDVKRRVEAMERRFHDSDVLKKGDKSKIESELKGLRERVRKLSEKIVSNPQDDLT